VFRQLQRRAREAVRDHPRHLIDRPIQLAGELVTAAHACDQRVVEVRRRKGHIPVVRVVVLKRAAGVRLVEVSEREVMHGRDSVLRKHPAKAARCLF
jgi:hypothetical protein